MDPLLITVPELKSIERHEVLDSTNTRAVRLVRESPPLLPHLVLAQKQTAGRGRGSNTWWSEEGSLTFSLLIEKVDGVAGLSLLTALATVDAVRHVSAELSCGIKWPNDVVLLMPEMRKLAGILIEIPAATSNSPATCVIGVGVNINQSFVNAPETLRERAISLREVLGHSVDTESFLAVWLHAFFNRLEQFQAGNPTLQTDWQSKCVLRNREVTVQSGASEFVGVCEGISASGELILKTSEGSKALITGSITRVSN